MKDKFYWLQCNSEEGHLMTLSRLSGIWEIAVIHAEGQSPSRPWIGRTKQTRAEHPWIELLNRNISVSLFQEKLWANFKNLQFCNFESLVTRTVQRIERVCWWLLTSLLLNPAPTTQAAVSDGWSTFINLLNCGLEEMCAVCRNMLAIA